MISKKQLRPELPLAKVGADMSLQEQFQNRVLRPIVKMQHELLMAMVRQELTLQKLLLSAMPEEKQLSTLRHILRRGPVFKDEVRGIIIGQFEVDEYHEYLSIKTEINKRISTIVEQRVLDSKQELMP